MENVLTILKEPKKVLRAKASEVAHEQIHTSHIQELLSQMKVTLAATPDGVGLAAPQIGEGLAIFIVSSEAEEIDRHREKTRDRRQKTSGEENGESKKSWNYYVFINPVMKNISRRKLEGPEGCLSVPGKFGTVKRHEKITIEAYDEYGEKFIRGASKFLARVLQHELDHLEGILFIDKTEELFEPHRPVPN